MLFILLILSLLLASCGKAEDKSAEGIMSMLDTGQGYIYINDRDISSINYISGERLGYLYYGEDIPPEETDCTESFCIFISKSISPGEIHIFKAKYQSDVDMLKRMLESRKQLLSKPQINPGSSEFLTDTAIECRVFSKGRFVFLTAGKGNELIPQIEKIF